MTAGPVLSRRLSTAALIVAAAGLLGAVTVGVLSRGAMFLLASENPVASGVISDDDFEMGRFTVAGSLNLVRFGLVVGLISGLLYLALERLRTGPGWFRVTSLSVGAGVAAASQIVHTDGVDFTLLQPVWLTVGLFVAIPVLHVGLLEVVADRIRTARAVPVDVWTSRASWVLRAALGVVFAAAVADLAGDIGTLG